MIELPQIQRKKTQSEQLQKFICSPKNLQRSTYQNNVAQFKNSYSELSYSNSKSAGHYYPQNISSNQGSSQQLQYLSYLQNFIDTAPGKSVCNDSYSQSSQHIMTSQYWRVLFLAVIYVKKRQQKTQIDDELMTQVISCHFKLGVIIPQPLDNIGNQLLKNGYFLLSYAISTARLRNSQFMFRYLMNIFSQNYQMETNDEEFFYYFDEYINKSKINQIFQIQNETLRGITIQGQAQNDNKNSNKLQVIKRACACDEISSNYSKTIQLEESQPQKSWC